jgi:hypothetical protein
MSIRRRLSLIAAVVIIGLVIQFGVLKKAQPVDPLFGGAEGLAVVTMADHVEAYRITLPEGKEAGSVADTEYRATAGPVALSKHQLSEVANALASSASYKWDSAKACGPPRHGVKLSFHRGASRIDVYLCFKCDELEVVRDGVLVGGEDFDPIRPLLLRMIKQLFPRDLTIQSLKE